MMHFGSRSFGVQISSNTRSQRNRAASRGVGGGSVSTRKALAAAAVPGRGVTFRSSSALVWSQRALRGVGMRTNSAGMTGQRNVGYDKSPRWFLGPRVWFATRIAFFPRVRRTDGRYYDEWRIYPEQLQNEQGVQ